MGGCAYDITGDPLPKETIEGAFASDAVLFGAIGGEQWDNLPREKRPESGLLRFRKELGVFANLRPAVVYDELINASSLKPDVVKFNRCIKESAALLNDCVTPLIASEICCVPC